MNVTVSGLSAKWPYNTARWRRLRTVKLAHNPTCFACGLRGRVAVANTVDHMKPINAGGDPFPAIEDLMSLCAPCHSEKTQRVDGYGRWSSGRRFGGCDEHGNPIDPVDMWHTGEGEARVRRFGYSIPDGLEVSAVPVVLIAGPPASGKSTYARDRMQPGDTLIDFDLYLKRAGGRMWDFTDRKAVKAAFRSRADALRKLAKQQGGTAWLIVFAPSNAERAAWCQALGCVHPIVLPVDADTCRQRINADPARQHSAEPLRRSVDRWWQVFGREGGVSSSKVPDWKPCASTNIDLFSHFTNQDKV